MRRLTIMLMATAALAACSDDTEAPFDLTGEVRASSLAARSPAASAKYEVSITNLTQWQPMTPPLAVTHRPPIHLFEVGEEASFGLQQIAENGNLEPMLQFVNGSQHARDVVVSAGDPVPPLLPGEERSFNIETSRGAMLFSFAAMLICTNDGFTGVNGLTLPLEVGESVSVDLDAYDAGTEINTEDFDDLVPPCGPLTGVDSEGAGTGMSDPSLAEDGVVRHHPGIEGDADLSVDIHGWSDPVARVVVTRIQ